ncbi:MAG: Trm112 family protein, partial [Anaerolineae bacterium]|nr:Trm112 family protein [Anaerolineae bacterium]
MINQDLLELLRCPACVKDKEGNLQFVKDTWLVCDECGRKYPIVEDIPVMLITEG